MEEFFFPSLFSKTQNSKRKQSSLPNSPGVVLLVQDRDQVQVVAVGVTAGLVVQRGDHDDARLLLDADGDGGAGKAAAVEGEEERKRLKKKKKK